jgi:hypothetical protein
MHITGTIDTNEIDRGLSRIDVEFQKVGETSKSVHSDFTRIHATSVALGSALGIMAVQGINAMVGMAKNSPATAAAMAMMDVSMFNLSNTIGNALSPAFEKISPMIQDFANFLAENQDTISTFVSDAVDVLSFSLNTLINIWNGIMGFEIPIIDIKVGEGLKFIIKTFGPALAGAAMGWAVGGPVGATAGLGIGLASTSTAATAGAGIGGIAMGIGAALAPETMGLSIPAAIAIGLFGGALAGWIGDFLSNRSRQTQLIDQTNSAGGSY